MSAVFYEPITDGPSFAITQRKLSRTFFNSSWRYWWLPMDSDEQKEGLSVTLFREGPYQLANKLEFTLTVETNNSISSPKVLKFNFDDTDGQHVFRVNLSTASSDIIKVTGQLSILDPGCISQQLKLFHDFSISDRPHDIVLNFGEKKLFCNKTVLALWSDYFDRLFYSETSNNDMKHCSFDDLRFEAVATLLNKCLTTRDILYADLDIDELNAAYYLQISVIQKRTKNMKGEYVYFSEDLDIKGRGENLMLGLELAKKFNLSGLQEAGAEFLREEFTLEEKKDFFTENKDRLRNLNWKSFFNLLDSGFNIVSDNWDDFVDLFDEEASDEPKVKKYKRTIDDLRDVTLIVGDQKIKVHRKYLAFWSPYFDRLFFGDFIEKNKEEIEIKDVDPEEFKVLLKLIYPPRDVVIDDSNVIFLLKLSDRFEMKAIMTTCGTYLCRFLFQQDYKNDSRSIKEVPSGKQGSLI